MSAEDRKDSNGVGGRRCLIVDDNERFLAVAQDHLTRDGMAVVGTATSQAEALRQAARLRPDIVLVDITLGHESGFELTHRLGESFPELRGRMVLISTHNEDDFVDLIKASPAVGFIQKNHLSARTIWNLVERRRLTYPSIAMHAITALALSALAGRDAADAARLAEARHGETAQTTTWHDMPVEMRAEATLEAHYWLRAARSVGLAR